MTPYSGLLSSAELLSIYCALYAMNEEGAEEDYLEEYEAEYAPDQYSEEDTPTQLYHALASLTSEILNDTGDRDITISWLREAGADDALIQYLGFKGGV